MISAVSGSLDRLSTEKDPCARYKPDLKLWIYLHAGRTIDDPKWNLHIDHDMAASFQRSQDKFKFNTNMAKLTGQQQMANGNWRARGLERSSSNQGEFQQDQFGQGQLG